MKKPENNRIIWAIQVVFMMILALSGLALRLIPNGMRFTGALFLGLAGLWLLGLLFDIWSKHRRAGRICKRVYLTGFCLLLTVLISVESVIIWHGETDQSALPVDAVIVLGAGVNGETPSMTLWSRIQVAEAYLKMHPKIPVVLSGGQGPGEDITEAEAMRRALWTEDSEENARYLLEEQSTNTAENLAKSKTLLESNGVQTDQAIIAVITNDFHCFRAHLIAQKQGLQTIDIPAELPYWWLTMNYYIREAFAVVKTVLFDS